MDSTYGISPETARPVRKPKRKHRGQPKQEPPAAVAKTEETDNNTSAVTTSTRHSLAL